MGIRRGTGILPVSCLLWNWHLASFLLIVELASCQFHAYCGTGILPVSCLLWNWHLASFLLIVELASCQFPAYCGTGRMPTLLLFIPKFGNAEFFPIPYSLVIQPKR
ncbi:MAG: hypothetical protein F6K26_52600 [Moorea sp. SIO2I5]|nr:hypothetical protein [Moorena sp. SIO2I5]